MGGITKEERARRAKLAKEGIKVCARCGKEMPFAMFATDKSTSDGMSRYCIECKTQYKQDWYADHSNEAKEYSKQYYKEHTEYYLEYSKEHKIDDPEYRKQYYAENKDVILNVNKRWRTNNVDKIKAYRQSERVRIMRKIYNINRKTAKLNSEGSYTKNDIADMLLFFDNKCAYTGIPLEESYHLDHIVPLSKGGTNYIWNIVPSNPSPNESKGAKDMESWFRGKEYFSEERLSKIYEWIKFKKQEIERNQ